MAFSVVNLSLTGEATELETGDIVFDLTEFKLPARCCKLVSVSLFNFGVDSSGDPLAFEGTNLQKYEMIFFQNNEGGNLASGGLCTVENLSSAEALLNKPIAFLKLTAQARGLFNNFNVLANNIPEKTDDAFPMSEVILTPDFSTSSHKMYVALRADTLNTNYTPSGASDFSLHLGFEY